MVYSTVGYIRIYASEWRSCQGADQRHALPFKPRLSLNSVDPNQHVERDLVSLGMPPAWHKRQVTEDPEYGIKI